jgi:mannitol/fructose-specific phosphotransferase system IIA component (Ntr-type)
MAVGRSLPGVAYENNAEPVRLIFVLGTPKSDPGGYLQLLGVLCRIFKQPANREALLAATTPEAFIERMLEFEARIVDNTPA